MIQIDYDPEADAIYIHLRDGEVDHTVESSMYIYVDVDSDGVPLGLEILFATNVLGERDMTSITFNVAARPTSDLATTRP